MYKQFCSVAFDVTYTSPDCLSHMQQRIPHSRYLAELGVLQIPFALVLPSVAYFYEKREPEKN